MTPKRSVVYRRDDVFIVETTNLSAEGVGLAGPATSVDPADGDEALGAAVLEAALSSQATLVPARDRTLPTPAMKLARARSWRAFVRGAASLHAEIVGTSVELDAWQRVEHDSFEPHDTVPSVVVDASPAIVGKAVRVMFAAIG